MAGDCCSMIYSRCLLLLQFLWEFRWAVALLGGKLLQLPKIKQYIFEFFFQHVKIFFISSFFAHVMVELECSGRHVSRTTPDVAYILI